MGGHLHRTYWVNFWPVHPKMLLPSVEPMKGIPKCNLQITHLEREIIWTKHPWFCSIIIFRGVFLYLFIDIHFFHDVWGWPDTIPNILICWFWLWYDIFTIFGFDRYLSGFISDSFFIWSLSTYQPWIDATPQDGQFLKGLRNRSKESIGSFWRETFHPNKHGPPFQVHWI